jgi:hypothetical protein
VTNDQDLTQLILERHPEVFSFPPFVIQRLDLAADQLIEMHGWDRTPQNRMNALEVMYATKAIDNIISPADRAIFADPTEFLNKAPAEGVRAYLESMETQLVQLTPEQQAEAAQAQEDFFIRTAPMEQVQKYLNEHK